MPCPSPRLRGGTAKHTRACGTRSTHKVEVADDLEPRRREELHDALDILLPRHQHQKVANGLVPAVGLRPDRLLAKEDLEEQVAVLQSRVEVRGSVRGQEQRTQAENEGMEALPAQAARERGSKHLENVGPLEQATVDEERGRLPNLVGQHAPDDLRTELGCGVGMRTEG